MGSIKTLFMDTEIWIFLCVKKYCSVDSLLTITKLNKFQLFKNVKTSLAEGLIETGNW